MAEVYGPHLLGAMAWVRKIDADQDVDLRARWQGQRSGAERWRLQPGLMPGHASRYPVYREQSE